MGDRASIDQYRQEAWFHGSITRVTAEERLDKSVIGTYLFREAESRPGLSLSVRVPDRIKHFMISQKDDGKWFLVGKPSEFDDMYKLIEYHGEHPTSSTDGTCLKYPCPVNMIGAVDDDDENPYVELETGQQVNLEVLDQVRRMSDERRASLQSPTTKAQPRASEGFVHKYEHVVPGQFAPPPPNRGLSKVEE